MVRDRSANFTYGEKSLLVDLVKERISIIENKKTDDVSRAVKNTAWEDLTSAFNAASSVHVRTSTTIKNAWENLKKKAKKNSAEERKEQFTRGGGSPKKIKCDPIFDIIIKMIKPQVEAPYNSFDTDGRACEALGIEPPQSKINVEVENISNHEENNLEPETDTLLRNEAFPSLLKTAVNDALQPSNVQPHMSATSAAAPTTRREDLRDDNHTHETRGTAWFSGRHPQTTKKETEINKAKLLLIREHQQHAIEEHAMLKELFVIKLEQEKEKLKQEKLKTLLLKKQLANQN